MNIWWPKRVKLQIFESTFTLPLLGLSESDLFKEFTGIALPLICSCRTDLELIGDLDLAGLSLEEAWADESIDKAEC